MKLRGYLEIVAAFALLYFIRQRATVGAGPDVLLWAVVFFPLRYGLTAGIVAAALATAIASEPVLASLLRGKAPDFFPDGFYAPASFWIIGLFVGLSVEQARRRVDYFRDVNRQWKEQLRKLQGNYVSIQHVADASRSRLLKAEETLPDFWRLSKLCSGGDPQDAAIAGAELIRKTAMVESGGIYLFENKRLVRKAAIGSPERMPEELIGDDLEQPVLKETLRTGRLTDVKKLGLARKEAGARFVACAAIPGRHAPRGVVLIRWMDFINFTAANLKNLEIGAEFVGYWLGRAYGEDLETSLANERMEAFRFRTFLQYVLWEVYRARRTGKPMSVAVFRFRYKCALPDFMLKVLSSIVIANLRRIDLVARHDDPGVILALLPETDAKGAAIAARNVAARLGEYGFSQTATELHFEYRIVDVPTDATDAVRLEALINRAAEWEDVTG